MSRSAKCMGQAAAEMQEVPSEMCGVLDEVLEAPCNTRFCYLGIWRVGEWDEGSCGSGVCASQGLRRIRAVSCVAALGGEMIDERECMQAGPKPISSSPCGSDCNGCGPLGDCYGNGECVASEGGPGLGLSCRCRAGFVGEFCEVPPSCLSGVIDAETRCCPGPVDATTGTCCTADSVTDSNGSCCVSGVLDACGVCDGLAIFVDISGVCCPSVSSKQLSSS
jgi:hypothetical protein